MSLLQEVGHDLFYPPGVSISTEHNPIERAIVILATVGAELRPEQKIEVTLRIAQVLADYRRADEMNERD